MTLVKVGDEWLWALGQSDAVPYLFSYYLPLGALVKILWKIQVQNETHAISLR